MQDLHFVVFKLSIAKYKSTSICIYGEVEGTLGVLQTHVGGEALIMSYYYLL